jgi:tetratricopeptide (TPR) repeat protein
MRADNDITPAAIAAELGRISESSAFRHSHRHQQFLRYLIQCKLDGRLAALREIAIGIDFFHRPASTYDPKTDAIVRVEAGRLRQRLDRYYQGEGVAAPFEISLDKGSYLPAFRVRAAAAMASGAQSRVAVLALPPATPAAEDVQRAAALTDEMVQTLSRLPHLGVLGAESSSEADVATAPQEARRRFNVAWIVRGSWTRPPGALLLEVVSTASEDVQLSRPIDAGEGGALAQHQRVRQELLHFFATPLAMRDATQGQVSGETRSAAPTQDLGAFDLYQRARYLLKQRNRAVLDKAIRHLEAAVGLDPGFGAAWAELAEAYVRRRQLVVDVAERDPGPAQRAAQRAIDLDRGDGTAYAILAGLAYVAEFDWPKADRLFARALEATPRELKVRQNFASFLMFSARFEESLREYDVVQALDPLDPASRCGKGALYFYWRRYERAETVLEQAIEMAPHDVYAWLLLADTYAQSGRHAEGLAASRHLIELAPDYGNSHVYLARALRQQRREKEAAATMQRARARFGASITEYEEAMFHIAHGAIEDTLACLERHALHKANGAHCMVVDPTFAPLYMDPRWSSMLRRAGLPDFSARLELQPS